MENDSNNPIEPVGSSSLFRSQGVRVLLDESMYGATDVPDTSRFKFFRFRDKEWEFICSRHARIDNDQVILIAVTRQQFNNWSSFEWKATIDV